MKEDQYKWHELKPETNDVIRTGDVREVMLPVQCYFQWSDFIPDEVDEEGGVITFKSGFIMNVLPGEMLYNNEPTKFLFDASKGKQS